MTTAVEYNLSGLGSRFYLRDLPVEWEGRAILEAADRDNDGMVTGDEKFSLDWIMFTDAVREVQALHQLQADGRLGPNTLRTLRQMHKQPAYLDNLLFSLGDLNFHRPEEPTAEPDLKVNGNSRTDRAWNLYGAAIEELSTAYDIGVDLALTVVAVEAGGRAYDPATGLVMIRFEPHIFKRYTGAAVAGGRNQVDMWNVIRSAVTLDLTAAIQSTSWGLGQVMGFNWEAVGATSPASLAAESQRSCRSQLKFLFEFCRPLERLIQAQDWAGFAKRYNGPGNVPTYEKALQVAHREALETLREMKEG